MFKRILVPVDGTRGSEQAVPYACDLAKALDAEIVVCTVITMPAAPNSSSREQEADTYVNKIADRFRRSGITVKTQVRRGEAPYEIKKGAIDWKVDAIVMATRSRQRVQKLVLGSVADIVVRDSHLPVLLVSSRRQRKRREARAA